MDYQISGPLAQEIDLFSQNCKLPLHSGVGRIHSFGDTHELVPGLKHQIEAAQGRNILGVKDQEFDAKFVVPASGSAKIFLEWSGGARLGKNFGKMLTIEGKSINGPFRLTCPCFYVKASSEMGKNSNWAVIAPTNEPAILEYGNPRPFRRISVLINNFDFEYGNITSDDGVLKTLRVEALGRVVDFEWRTERLKLLRLVQAEALRNTALVSFSFDVWPGASEPEILTFIRNVSTLCSIVAGQFTGTPIIYFFDEINRPIKCTIIDVVESKFRKDSSIRCLNGEFGLPRLFTQCFEEHCRMQTQDEWRRFVNFFSSIDDPIFMELRYGTLMSAVELFMRISLIEKDCDKTNSLFETSLPDLISLVKRRLQWEVPKHYTVKDRYRMTRNAAQHGNELPFDIQQVWADFAKWKLFLRRRVFIRLGFDGLISSPENGWSSISRVDEFSEKHNTFTTKLV